MLKKNKPHLPKASIKTTTEHIPFPFCICLKVSTEPLHLPGYAFFLKRKQNWHPPVTGLCPLSSSSSSSSKCKGTCFSSAKVMWWDPWIALTDKSRALCPPNSRVLTTAFEAGVGAREGRAKKGFFETLGHCSHCTWFQANSKSNVWA